MLHFPYHPPSLDSGVLNGLRTPVDPSHRIFTGDEEDSGDEATLVGDPVGAFPGTSQQYGGDGRTYY